MRVSNTHKLVFVSVPKTGSHTGFKIMEDNFNGFKVWGHYHNVIVPSQYKDYRAFTFVRNPYDRVAALWNSIFCTGDSENHRKFYGWIGAKDFKSFCLWLSTHPYEQLNWRIVLVKPQHVHLEPCNVKLYHVHTENMLEDFNKFLILNNIPIIDSVPWELKRPHKTFKELADLECTAAINKWAGKDFEIFGYEKE